MVLVCPLNRTPPMNKNSLGLLEQLNITFHQTQDGLGPLEQNIPRNTNWSWKIDFQAWSLQNDHFIS